MHSPLFPQRGACAGPVLCRPADVEDIHGVCGRAYCARRPDRQSRSRCVWVLACLFGLDIRCCRRRGNRVLPAFHSHRTFFSRVETVIRQSQPAETTQKIALEMGKAIARLHSADMVHGDLTTSNMLWKETGLVCSCTCVRRRVESLRVVCP